MKNKLPSLSIVVPIYNEAANLPQIINRIDEVARDTGHPYEIICVDDGSSDESCALLEECQELRIIKHPTNLGYGAALKTGFDVARDADLIAFIDADATYPPSELPNLLAAIQQNRAALMCIGSRMSSGHNDMEVLRIIGNRLYARLCQVLFKSQLSDVCSGMRVFRSDLFHAIDWGSFSNDLDFSPQFTSRCLKSGVKVIEVPIDSRERGGHSKLKIFNHGWRFLGSILREKLL